MLELMRKHAKFFYVLFFIVILSFIFWGVGTVDKTGGEAVVAEVGKYKITADEFWKTYDRVIRFYRELYRGKFDEETEKKLNLKEKVLESMIDEKVLLIAAKDAGIRVSDEELREAITHEPAFMRNGVFDQNVYLNRLRLNRITVEAYENAKRQELTLNKMRRLIELSVDVTEISIQIKQAPGDERLTKMTSEAMLRDKRDKAVRSYIEGLKKQMKIKRNIQLIS
jgi:peptidyl-prolyl cis-trans isomerase D